MRLAAHIAGWWIVAGWSVIAFPQAAVSGSEGQSVSRKLATRPDFATESRLFLVPVTVTDPRGVLVNGLKVQSFEVLEEKQSQPIVSFFETDVPCSMGVVFDLSASMRTKLAEAKRALRVLLDHAGPDDEAMLIGVADRASLRSPFTGDLTSLVAGISLDQARGDTALNDAIVYGFGEMNHARNRRRALIVISDGVDNKSRHSRRELLRQAVEAGIEVHTIALFDPPAFKKPIEYQEEQNGVAFLDELAKATGGLNFVVRDESGMSDAALKIGRALRSQYVIGYRPIGDRDGKYHRMQVKVRVPGTQVHWRRAYYSD